MSSGTRAVRSLAAVLTIGSLAACANNSPQRAAEPALDVSSVPGTSSVAPAPAPAPSPTVRSRRGNPPFYTVLGKRYHVLPTSAGYVQRGVASWYGRDFHGLATSSGETYTMHAMTAAHTTLPLPTWVEVTNLANG